MAAHCELRCKITYVIVRWVQVLPWGGGEVMLARPLSYAMISFNDTLRTRWASDAYVLFKH